MLLRVYRIIRIVGEACLRVPIESKLRVIFSDGPTAVTNENF